MTVNSEYLRKALETFDDARREEFEERAGIKEFEGGMSRERSEWEAFFEMIWPSSPEDL